MNQGPFVLAIAMLALSDCEVAFFDERVSLAGAGAETSGPARACDEPDDARQARTGGRCSERCVIAGGRLDGEGCESVVLGQVRDGVATLSMRQSDGVVLTVEICDPAGVVMQISDSPTADRDGGDAGSTSHDADVLLEETALTMRASARAGIEPSRVTPWVPGQGCVERTIVLADRIVYLVETDAGLCGDAMLRIDPPSDEEGAADALWYLGLDGTIDGSVRGSGIRRAELCFW